MRKPIYLLMFFLGNLNILAQNSNFQYAFQTPPSPNAASLGKYGEIPVDYYSGLPKVNIPLFSVATRSLKFDLGLSYHMGGIRVDEEASWVGLGWSLTGPGLITRVRRDKDDDYNSQNCPDQDPDIFYYNFQGQAGKFVIHPVTKIITLINQDAITVSKIDPNTIVPGFLITLNNGVKLYFDIPEYQEETDESSVSSFTTVRTLVSSWHLSKIESPDGDIITFEYSDEYPAERRFNSFTDFHTSSVSVSIIQWPSGANQSPACYTLSELGLDMQDPKVYFIIGNYTTIKYRDKYLKKINFSQGSISFITSNRDDYLKESTNTFGQKLDEVIVKSNAGLITKRISFSYSYLNSQANNGALSKRLLLNQCSEISAGAGEIISKYQFVYNSTQLPDKNSRDQDYWGFYNGPKNNPITPSQRNNQPDPLYAKAASLEKIIYPTGGFTTFALGLHEYVSRLSASIVYQGGGLRINQITSYTSDGQISGIRKYEYKKLDQNNQSVCSGKSIGVIRNWYDYINDYYNDPYNYTRQVHKRGTGCQLLYNNGIPIIETATIRYLTHNEATSSSNTLPLGEYSGNGSPVCYDKVIEYFDETGNNGKNEYEYRNDYATPDLSGTYYAPNNMPQVVPITNGQILRSAVYKKNGTAYDLLKESIFGYTSKSYQEITGKRKCDLTNIYASCGWQLNYKIFSDWLVLSSITTNERSGNNQILTDNITFSYDNSSHKQMTGSQQTQSSGNIVNDIFKYPSDFAASNSVYQSMINKNITGPVIEHQKTITSNGIVKTVFKAKTEYDNFYSTLQMPRSEFYQVGDNQSEEKIRYDYNNQGRLIEQNKINDFKSSYIYDYNGVLPIAEVTNAPYSDIAYTSFEADGTGKWLGINNSNIVFDPTSPTGRKCYRIPPTVGGALISKYDLDASKQYTLSYWSKSGPIAVYYCKQMPNFPSMQYIGYSPSSSFAGQNGWTYYEHLIQNTSTINIGCDLSNGVCGAQGEAGMTCSEKFLDELRLYPKDAQMTTYTYDPLVGMTAQCDQNNKIAYYEYDILGRLIHLRDQNKNILKKLCYNYKGQAEDCTNNATALWKSTGNYRCALNSSGENTGYQERQEIDNNPFSTTYAQVRWVDNGYNASICPPPYSCNPSTCYGEEFSCINGQCEQGYRVNTMSYYDYSMGQYVCVYHYEFSDGSWSGDYYQYSYWPCYLQ